MSKRNRKRVLPTELALEKVKDQVFKGQPIEVDEKHFENCTFIDCIFRFNGGNFKFTKASIYGTIRFETQNAAINNAVRVLKLLGLLNQGFAASWADLPK